MHDQFDVLNLKTSKDKKYFWLSYTNRRVKKELKTFFQNFTKLTEAVEAFVSLSDQLNSKYRFVDHNKTIFTELCLYDKYLNISIYIF